MSDTSDVAVAEARYANDSVPSVNECMASTIDLLSAYVSNNSVDTDKLVPLFNSMFNNICTQAGLKQNGAGHTIEHRPAEGVARTAEPAQAPKQSEPKAVAAASRTPALAPEAAPTASFARSTAKDEAKSTEVAAPKAETADRKIKAAPRPAVPISKSVDPDGDYIICLEDGKKLKVLKRHLMSHFQMTPEQYKAKWNLPKDYPLVAPNYSAARAGLAKGMGLGKRKVEAGASA